MSVPQRRVRGLTRCSRARAAIFKTHDALRADLADLGKALDAMETAEASGEPRAGRVRTAAQHRRKPRITLSLAACRALALRGAASRGDAARTAALTKWHIAARRAGLTAFAPRLQLWMLTNLKKWFHAFEHNSKHHFEVQDKFFVPLGAFRAAGFNSFQFTRPARAQWPPR